MKMATVFQKQVEVSETSALALPSTRIRASCFPDASKSRNEPATLRITQEVVLNFPKHVVRRPFGQFL